MTHFASNVSVTCPRYRTPALYFVPFQKIALQPRMHGQPSGQKSAHASLSDGCANCTFDVSTSLGSCSQIHTKKSCILVSWTFELA